LAVPRLTIARALIGTLAALIVSNAGVAGPLTGQLDDIAAASVAYGSGDYATALRLLRPLADQGNTIAKYDLGVMYKFGWGVPQDYVIAHMWFNLAAADGGNFGAMSTQNRDELSSKMTSSQIAEAQKLAREWKPK
jgi:TPR repeat protein